MLENLQFQLRQRWLGRLALRRGLPKVRPAPSKFDECAYYRKLFCAAMDRRTRRQVARVIDVGCRNWSYVPAMADCFPRAALLGVELDGYRRYWNMYRRIDYAQAHAARTGRPARAVCGDFRDVEALDATAASGKTLFCFVFPFVTENPCLRWGLPEVFADYAALLRHALRLAPAHQVSILAVHQGDWEIDAARKVYSTLGLDMRAVKLMPDAWTGIWPSPHANWICYGAPASLAESLVH